MTLNTRPMVSSSTTRATFNTKVTAISPDLAERSKAFLINLAFETTFWHLDVSVALNWLEI